MHQTNLQGGESVTTVHQFSSPSPSLSVLNSGPAPPAKPTGSPHPESTSHPQVTGKNDRYLVLSTLLDHNQSSSLHLVLAQRAKAHLSVAEVQELLTLLEKMGFGVEDAEDLVEDKEELHCVRCHETYFERDNVGSPCLIEHEVFNGEGTRWGPDIYRYTCESCGEDGMEDGAGNGIDWPNHGICYEGEHTTDPDEVDYDDDNTLTCEAHGCLHEVAHAD